MPSTAPAFWVYLDNGAYKGGGTSTRASPTLNTAKEIPFEAVRAIAGGGQTTVRRTVLAVLGAVWCLDWAPLVARGLSGGVMGPLLV